MVVKILILVTFFLVMILVGVNAKKKVTGVDDFVLGGRKIGPWMAAFSFGTSYFSAVIFVGYAGQFGWKFGIASTWIGIGNALIGSMLAWVILGRRTRVMTNHLKSSTIVEINASRSPSTVRGNVFRTLSRGMHGARIISRRREPSSPPE